MTRALWRLALVLLTCITLTPPPAAEAQGLAAMAVATTFDGAGTAMQPKPGCWGCQEWGHVYDCRGGFVPGSWNCSLSISGCNLSSPGCGASALVPVDLDGAAQYVSRAVMQLREAGTGNASPPPPGEERNCDGVVVARQQSPDNIAGVRIRTAALSL